ncbi:MAG: hypothetical protein LBF51_03975 [Zoogloeaceae bacterium]|nr:hypothetical protein [Zoogloeaceae bacterium]
MDQIEQRKLLIAFVICILVVGILIPFTLKETGSFTILAMLMLLGALGCIVWVLLVRNKKTFIASPQQKQAALAFQPVAGKGVLYLFRFQSDGLLAGLDI